MRVITGMLIAFLAVSPAFADFKNAAAYNDHTGGVSFVVIKDGALVFEDYPNGGAPDKAWPIASGTKSFSGVIAAAAVRDGLLTLDEPAADSLKEWRDDARKSQITIRQLLSLTSGLQSAETAQIPTYAEAVATPASATPGSVFAYAGVNLQVFGEIMRRKLKTFENGRYKDAVEYLQARILDPVGISVERWRRMADGHPTLPSGAVMTARDWARFGLFVLQGGRWEGAQLVDAEALAENFQGSDANAAYGLTWWLNDKPSAETVSKSPTMQRATDMYTNPDANKLPHDLIVAGGAGGQRLYVIPSRNLVIVRQYPGMVESDQDSPFSDVAFLLSALAD
ncbi:MAG: serine hydrolase domain-containing protein [Parvularculaceae bacterium]